MSDNALAMRYLLIGVHLEPQDAAIDGMTALPAAGLTISAKQIADDDSPAAPELLQEIVRLRSALTEKQTFIAIRYGAPVRDSREAEERIGSRAAKWRSLLEEYRDHFEVSLKIAPSERAVRPAIPDVADGKEYLRKLHASRRASEVADDAKIAIAHRFEFARRTTWRRRADGGTEFVALVHRDELHRLAGLGEMLQKQLPELPFLLSGPWPLEVFADD